MATSKVMGTVTSAVGEVKATASDGTVRVLQVGDKVFSDEVISTSPNGDVKIALEGGGGQSLECGADATLALSPALLGIGTTAAADGSPVLPPSVAAQQEMAAPPAGKPGAPADVAALQAAIASGADPTQVADATAAGGAPGAGGAQDGGSHSPVILEQGNVSGVVTAGFNTQGASIQFPTPEFNQLPPEEGTPVVSVSVQVQVQVDVENPGQPGGSPGGLPGDSDGDGVVISGNTASLIEGTNGDGKQVNFIISLDKAFDTDVQVTYSIVPGTASTPSDFFDGPLTQTVTIVAGETQIIVPVTIVQDHLVEGNETFNIVLTDAVNATINPDADTAVVTIVDDDALPVANADTNWVQEDLVADGDDAPAASGNVLLNQVHSGDPSSALSFADAADTDFEPLTVTTTGTFNGTYGTLVLHSDGSYTYTLSNGNAAVQALDDGETLTDSFNYSVTDGFNTPSSSTVTITIFGSNDGPEITVRTGNEDPFSTSAQGTVFEEALGIGSNPQSNGEFVTGSFQVSDPNGLDDIETVTINDQVVDIDNLVGASFSGDAGTLTITAYSNGIAQFTYELTQAVTDGEGPETDVFTLRTSDGDNESAPATITISILDDLPVATNDSGGVLEDEVQVASGNVLSNDDANADEPASFVSWDSEAAAQFGTIQLNADGSYVYTLNDAAVQFLNDGETRTESYNYTMRDADGDTDTATLTITITGSDDGVTITDLTPSLQGGEATVSDANLADGSAPNAAALTKTGDFSVSAPDGIASLTVGGTAVITDGVFSAATVTTALGNTLEITGYDAATGKVSYSYTLSDNETHTQPANDTSLFDDTQVVLTDDDGDTTSSTLSINVLDDVPSVDITAGSNSVVEGQTISNGAWTSDAGADGGVVKVVFDGNEYNLGDSIDTGKGTLTINSNGTWTFAAALNQDGPQGLSFDLKITDADGDLATDSHTINITDGAGPAASAPDVLVVDESALPDGANPTSDSETDTATLSFTSGSDAITSIVFGSTAGITVSGLDNTQTIVWSITNAGRTLIGSVDGVDAIRVDLSGASNVEAGGSIGNVTATASLLTDLLHESNPDADSLTINNVQVVGQDTDGTTAIFTFTGITVIDDAPSVSAPSGTIENDAGESLAGLIDYDMNADGLGSVTLTAPTVTSGGEPLALTSHGETVAYHIADLNGDGLQELYAYVDTDDNGFDEGDTAVFTLAPSSAGAADGSYTLTMQDVVDLPVPTVTLNFSGISASGPIEEINVDGQMLISTVSPASDNVNANNGFVGINNNIMNDGESVRYEFGTVTATGTPGDFNIAHDDVNDLQLNIFNTGSGSDTFQWTALKDGAQVGQGSVTFSGDGLTSPIHIDGGYDTIVLEVTDGAFKVGGVTFTEVGAPQDVNLNVAFGGSDADGDAIGGSFDITITSGDGTAETQIVQTLLNNNQQIM